MSVQILSCLTWQLPQAKSYHNRRRQSKGNLQKTALPGKKKRPPVPGWNLWFPADSRPGPDANPPKIFLQFGKLSVTITIGDIKRGRPQGVPTPCGPVRVTYPLSTTVSNCATRILYLILCFLSRQISVLIHRAVLRKQVLFQKSSSPLLNTYECPGIPPQYPFLQVLALPKLFAFHIYFLLLLGAAFLCSPTKPAPGRAVPARSGRLLLELYFEKRESFMPSLFLCRDAATGARLSRCFSPGGYPITSAAKAEAAWQ